MKSGACREFRVVYGCWSWFRVDAFHKPATVESSVERSTVRNHQSGAGEAMVVVQMPACRRDQLTPSSDHVSWFEPLAGITSDYQGELESSTADRGPWRCAGVTNRWWDVGPLSPAIRERACPGPGLDLESDPDYGQEEQGLGSVLWR
jgi:hypothetical protein